MQPYEPLVRRILQLRGRRVILDQHLAQLCGVPTKQVTQPAEAPKRRRIGFVQD